MTTSEPTAKLLWSVPPLLTLKAGYFGLVT